MIEDGKRYQTSLTSYCSLINELIEIISEEDRFLYSFWKRAKWYRFKFVLLNILWPFFTAMLTSTPIYCKHSISIFDALWIGRLSNICGQSSYRSACTCDESLLYITVGILLLILNCVKTLVHQSMCANIRTRCRQKSRKKMPTYLPYVFGRS